MRHRFVARYDYTSGQTLTENSPDRRQV